MDPSKCNGGDLNFNSDSGFTYNDLTEMIKGIDVSKHNGKIDWVKLRQNGYEFVYIKHSQGVGSLDPKFSDHFQAAKAAGLKVGLYHFASLNNPDEVADAKAEAEYFILQTRNVKADLLPVIDVETNEVNLTPSEVEQWIQTYYDTLGGKCILYSGSWFLNSNLNPNHRLGNIPLWLSSYPFDRSLSVVNETLLPSLKNPKPPVGWTDYIMWQWSGKGTIDGVKGLVDMNLAKILKLAW